jgi:hypothetical protein
MRAEERLMAMGFSLELINMLPVEDKVFLSTGLTNFNEEFYNNPWYTPGGAANITDVNDNMDYEARFNEIIRRLEIIEANIARLNEVAYDEVNLSDGVMDVSGIK